MLLDYRATEKQVVKDLFKLQKDIYLSKQVSYEEFKKFLDLYSLYCIFFDRLELLKVITNVLIYLKTKMIKYTDLKLLKSFNVIDDKIIDKFLLDNKITKIN